MKRNGRRTGKGRLWISTGIVMIAAVFFLPMAALGEFKGSDSLALDSGNWDIYPYAGNGNLVFRNSRLEFLVASPEGFNAALTAWKPNRGSYRQSWFVQVDAHLDKPVIPNESYFSIGITVESTAAGTKSCSQLMTRTRANGINSSGFVLSEAAEVLASIESPAKSATLRLHFDAVAKQLIGSVRSGNEWRYSAPVDIRSWGMGTGDEFIVSLFSHNGAVSGLGTGLENGSGSAYFKNFKAGPAAPEISVYQRDQKKLTDGKSKMTFGSATINRRGQSKVFWLTNEGTAPLEDLKVVADGLNPKDFTVSQPESTLLLPGGWTKFKVTFRPKAVGLRSATFRLKSNDSDEASFDVKLVGMGK